MINDYKYVVDNLKEGIIGIDDDLRICCFNKAAKFFTGLENKDVIGKKCSEILKNSNGRQNPITTSFNQNCISNLSPVYIKNKNKEHMQIKISNILIKDEKEVVKGIIKTFIPYEKSNSIDSEKFKEFGLFGTNLQMRKIFKLIEAVAPTNSNVLILGETGTGKGLVAKAIHKLSLRKDKPFVVVNCAAIPDNLLESELFGHEKGAFTDAQNQRIGRIETVEEGTIFLDEIGGISPSFQAKLLRVLEEKKFERLGSSKVINADIRVIVATNKDLYSLVQKKLFREDLYYRLNVFPIEIPPLRERAMDTITIANHFINKYNVLFKQQKIGLSEESKSFLLNYEFPGNVRELRNAIEYAFIKSNNDIIEIEDFPSSIKKHLHLNSKRTVIDLATEIQLHEITQKHEMDHVLSVIKACNGNKSEAARKLGISRKTVYNKLKAN